MPQRVTVMPTGEISSPRDDPFQATFSHSVWGLPSVGFHSFRNVLLSHQQKQLNALLEGCQALYICKHFSHLDIKGDKLVHIFGNNQSAITIIKSPSSTYQG